MSIFETLKSEQLKSLKSKQKERLKTIRLMLSELQSFEINSGVKASDEDILVILSKMLKQRQESMKQYKEAGRDDLFDIEHNESEIIKSFMPQPLSDADLIELIESSIKEVNATSLSDMSKVMGSIKPKIIGRADMSFVSSKIKQKLS